MVLANQVDVLPAQRHDMCHRCLCNLLPQPAQRCERFSQVNSIPCSKGAITEFSQATKEELTSQRGECFSFIESDQDATAERLITNY